MSPLRILVTASRQIRDTPENRTWMRDALLRDGLSLSTIGTPVLVHGAQVSRDPDTDGWMGGDWLAEQVWNELAAHLPGGLNVERHPAADHPDPKARNAHMVSLGAHVALAFADRWASGTGHCARLARKAAIPTIDYGVDTRIEARP